MEKRALHRVMAMLLVMLLALTQMPFTALAEDIGAEPPSDGNSGVATPAVTFTIAKDAYGGTSFELPGGVAVTDDDLLVGVSAVDENGGNVTVTVADAGGLDYDNPQPQMTGWMNNPYTITYEAIHPDTREIFPATREVYVSMRAAAVANEGDSSSNPATNETQLRAAISAGTNPIYINAAIALASDLDGYGYKIIQITANTRHFTVANGAAVTITNLTLDGNNKTGGGINNNGDLTLDGVTIQDCSADYGGGISNAGTLTLDGVTIQNCSADHGGGGIQNYNATLTLTGSTIQGCTASLGGGIYNNAYAGNGNIALATLELVSSTVSGNTADVGGGIYNNAYGGGAATAEVDVDAGSAVTGNSATSTLQLDGGGGIFNATSGTGTNSTNVDISGTVSGNTAANGNGAGIISNGEVTVKPGGNVTNGIYNTANGVINNNGTITIPQGEEFFNDTNETVTNNGTVNNYGTITNKGMFDNNGGVINNYPGGVINGIITGGTINQITTPPPSRRSGGGSGGTTTVQAAPTPVTIQEALDALGNALANRAPGQTKVTVRFVNRASIPLDVLKALTGAAKKAGVTVTIHADTVSNGAVQTRLYIDPAKATKGITLMASADSPDAVNTANRFKSRFKNKLTAVSTGQKGDFGQPVELAVKLDLSGMDTDNLYFYSYDKKNNTYKRIENPAYWFDKNGYPILPMYNTEKPHNNEELTYNNNRLDYYIDANGYLHFTTELAGDIIISDGPLVKK